MRTFPRICFFRQTCRTSTLGCHFSKEGFAQVPFRWSLHGMWVIFPDGLRLLGFFAFAESFTLSDIECSGEGVGWVVGLARSFVSCPKLQLSSFEHCLMAFHCQPCPSPLRTRRYCLWFLTSMLDSISHFWLQNSSSSDPAQYFFWPLSSICDNQVLPSLMNLQVVQF